MRYFKKIIGERIYLSPMNPDDAEIYTKWLNDYEVMRYLGGYGRSYSFSAERAALEKLSTEGQNFSIIRASDDSLLGSISLMDVDHLERKATLGIFIGEAENRGQGYGAEAIRLITRYGFETLNLHNIMLVVHADNERAIACYRKAGFTEFGRRTDACFKDGRYVDELYMQLLE